MTFFFCFPVQRLSPHPAPFSTLVLAWTVPYQREEEGARQEVSDLSASSPSSGQAAAPFFLTFQPGLTSCRAQGQWKP